MENKNSPSYYAIVPARVRYSDITANAKLLYGEITALSSEKGYCWASNKHFSDLYGVSTKQVSLWFKQLSDKKFIEIELIKSQSGTLRKVYIMEEKVIRALQKGNVRNTSGTTPKGNTSIKPSTKINREKDSIMVLSSRGQHSPAKEKLRQKMQELKLKRLENSH